MVKTLQEAGLSLQQDITVQALRELCRRLNIRGHLIGGAVRDVLLARSQPKDLDVYFECSRSEISRIVDGYRAVTATAPYSAAEPLQHIDIFTTQNVVVSSGFSDFTINSITYDLIAGELTDRWGGVKDLEAKVLRITNLPYFLIGRPFFRLFRIAQDLQFTYATETLQAIKEYRYLLSAKSPVDRARAMNELLRILSVPNSRVLVDLVHSQILESFIPVLTPLSHTMEEKLRMLETAPHTLEGASPAMRAKVLEVKEESLHTGKRKFSSAFNLLSQIRLALLLDGCAEALLFTQPQMPEVMRSPEALQIYRRRIVEELADSVGEDPRMKQVLRNTVLLLEKSEQLQSTPTDGSAISENERPLYAGAAVLALTRSGIQKKRLPPQNKIELERILATL
jgi:tRNA nucleotidyltransferase/poly(A) polymerase